MFPAFFALLLIGHSALFAGEPLTAPSSSESWVRTIRWAVPLHADSVEHLSKTDVSIAPVEENFADERITLHGVKSLEVGVGDGVAIRQGLELELQGDLGDGTRLYGLLHDQDFPLEGAGGGSSLQEIDKLWLRLERDSSWLHLGDQNVQQGERGELRYFERSQQGLGAGISTSHFATEASWGGGRSSQRRVELSIINGVSEGYDLGLSGGLLKIVPGSVRVWHNSRLLDSGEYRVDEMAGTVDLLSSRLLSSLDRVVVEFQEVEHESSGDWGHWSSQLRSGRWSLEGGLSWMQFGKNARSDSTEQQQPEALMHLRTAGALGPGGDWSVEWARSADHLDGDEFRECGAGCGDALRWSWQTPRDFPLEWVGWGRWLSGFRPWNGLDQPIDFERKWGQQSDSLASHLLLEQGLLYRFKSWQLVSGVDLLHQPLDDHADAVLSRVGMLHRGKSSHQKSFLEWGGWQQEGQPFVERQRWESEAGFVAGGFYPTATSRVDLWSRGGEMSSRHLSSELSLRKEWQLFYWSGGAQAELRQTDSRDNWLDSLRQLSAHQQLQFLHAAGSATFDAAWQETEADGESAMLTAYDLVNQTALRGGGRLNFSLKRHRSFAQPLIKQYRRVPDGAGDVAFDSTVGRWIEGVDLGDHIFDGWVRDSTVDQQLRLINGWQVRLEQPLGGLLGISRGFLSDLALWGEAAWERRDSSSIAWSFPSFESLQKGEEGRWHRSGGVVWTPPLFASRIELSHERDDQKWSGMLSGVDRQLLWSGRSEQQWSRLFYSRIDLAREENGRDQTEWKGWRGDLEGEWRWNSWSFFPLYGWQTARGERLDSPFSATLVRPGVRGEWRGEQQNRLYSEYRWNKLENGGVLLPWEVSQGYGGGITHRWECGVEWEALQSVVLNGAVILHRTPQGSFRHKVRVEGRGVF